VKILIVDDSATMRKIIRRNLRQAGINPSEVVEVSDGKEGCEALEKDSSFDLILCDVNMPNMNGLDFLDHVRAKAETAETPVVMITTESTPDAVKTFVAHGASGCVAKPFSPEQLEAVLSNFV